jgi:AmmeMemoRadiSam system protein B
MSIMPAGAWQTPLGLAQIDEELCEALMDADSRLTADVEAHRHEHALEVQLPFLQAMVGPSLRFAPITVGTGSLERLHALGDAIAAVVKSHAAGTLTIASSDMNHYEPDAITRVKDRLAIGAILKLDPDGLYDVVRRENISMCGFGPAVSMLRAAKALGAIQANLVKYATSGDVSLDFDRVVGYAGITVS